MFPTPPFRLRARAIGLALVCLSLVFQAPPAADAQTATPVAGEEIRPAVVATVNFDQLSRSSTARRAAAADEEERLDAALPPGTVEEAAGDASAAAAAGESAPAAAPQLSIASPAPSASFLAQEDSPRVGTNSITIPPDTMGAVGLDKIFVNLNNNYRVQDKATGAPLSTVSINTFWAATGATGVFDPRVQYDPYNNRWLVSAVSSAQTANSSVLVGVSHTSDPQGNWTLFRFVVGCAPGAAGCNAAGEWADFPMLGFNKNWVAVGWNQFTINTGVFASGKMLILNYPTLRGGAAQGVLFTNPSGATGFCMHPATTFSPTEETLFVPAHQSSASAIYRLHRITGTPAAPVFTLDPVARVRPGGGWVQPGGNIVPQNCTSGCPATLLGLDSGDSFIRSNVVFRNGRIYYAQTVGINLPGGTPIDHTAAQWTALNPNGSFADGGRVEDPTATTTNGGKWYFYPSLSVNRNDDVMLGFSVSSSVDFAAAAYSFRFGTDPAGAMRDPVVYKAGEDYYQKTFSGTRNRWGDYSHTVVDPVGDRNLWTIQEYAATRVPPAVVTATNSKWGTWWAKVVINNAPVADAGPDQTVECANGSASVTLDGTGSTDPDGDPLTYTWTDENGNVIATGATPTVSLPLGTHTITLTVTDPDGFSDTDTVTINVVDTTAPTLSEVTATPNVLWPPNHKLVDVTVNYTTSDSCCDVTSALSVTSNEPDNGTGDGDTEGDIVIVNEHLVRLRAERSGGGNGRIYTITVTATDCAGNSISRQTTVVVPKSQKK